MVRVLLFIYAAGAFPEISSRKTDRTIAMPQIPAPTPSRVKSLLPSLSLAFVLLAAGCGLKTADREDMIGSAKARKVISTAYSQMGKRYRSGGESPREGFDCSGLIWWAYRQHGVKVPRIAADQARAGVAVPRHKLLPGDIVVFRTRQGPSGLHTGLYAGDRSFIHSPRKGERVRMESLEIPYWKSRFATARRVAP